MCSKNLKDTYDSVLTIFRMFGLLVISIAFVNASIICGTSKIKSPCKIEACENMIYLLIFINSNNLLFTYTI